MPDRLEGYHARRDFDRSPEPPGEPGSDRAGPARFVVQEHDATRLHWDLRIEHDGVLASWALPRFLPGAPGENLIAIRTEDHPLDYLAFEGEIPAGSYGAGTMRIYDQGTVDILEWQPRKVEVRLRGERLTGCWALFPLAKRGESGDEWMIHRMGAPLDPDAEPMPDLVAPMLAQAGNLPTGRAWAFEVKWDGVRAICRSEPGRLRLWSRNANEITAGYPEIARLNRALHEHRAILDGEIVAFSDGRPSFQALQRRMHVRDERRVRRLAGEIPVTYVIFDLLWLDGHPLTDLPYSERRALLEGLELHGTHWQVPDAVQGSGEDLMSAAAGLGLEGVVAKRLDAPYQPGRRSPAWVKVKRRPTGEFVIGGWVTGEGGGPSASAHCCSGSRTRTVTCATPAVSVPGSAMQRSKISPGACRTWPPRARRSPHRRARDSRRRMLTGSLPARRRGRLQRALARRPAAPSRLGRAARRRHRAARADRRAARARRGIERPRARRRSRDRRDEPRQGPLPAGGLHQARGDRVLRRDRAGDAQASGRSRPDAEALSGRGRRRGVLREARARTRARVGQDG